jgi:hypothetical protein
MARKDGQRRAFDRSPAGPLGFAHPGGLSHETDSLPAERLLGDIAEEAGPSWETAWIDLGGEG